MQTLPVPILLSAQAFCCPSLAIRGSSYLLYSYLPGFRGREDHSKEFQGELASGPSRELQTVVLLESRQTQHSLPSATLLRSSGSCPPSEEFGHSKPPYDTPVRLTLQSSQTSTMGENKST